MGCGASQNKKEIKPLQKIQDEFDAMDKDGDGLINVNDYASAQLQKEIKQNKQPIKQENEGEDKTMKLIFDNLDVDNDGVITFDEFKNGIGAFDKTEKDREMRQVKFMEMDKFGDGLISFEEFKKGYYDCMNIAPAYEEPSIPSAPPFPPSTSGYVYS